MQPSSPHDMFVLFLSALSFWILELPMWPYLMDMISDIRILRPSKGGPHMP